MALPLRRGCLHALLLVLALALVGCGGVPEGPLLPANGTEPPVPEDAQSRAVSLTRIGDTALRSGEIETAVGLFEQATLTDGRNVTAALGLGDALLAAGRDLDASRAFERALAIQPNLPAAAYGYARSMIAIQRPEVAVAHLSRLVTQNPSSVEALNALGVAQDLLGDHAAATATYRQALGVVPASTSVRNNLALSLALQEKFADAVDLLRPLAEGPEATRRARQNLALVYGMQGDMRAAERISRVDLGGPDLANNLAYFAAVRGIEEPSVRAAALAPEQMLAAGEPRLTRKSKSVRRAAARLTQWVASCAATAGACRRPSRRHRLPARDRWCRSLAMQAAGPQAAAPGSSMSAASSPPLQPSNGVACAQSTLARSPGSAGWPAPMLGWNRCWSARSPASRRPRACARNSARTLTPAGRCSSSALMHSEAAAWRGWSPAVRSRRMGWGSGCARRGSG